MPRRPVSLCLAVVLASVLSFFAGAWWVGPPAGPGGAQVGGGSSVSGTAFSGSADPLGAPISNAKPEVATASTERKSTTAIVSDEQRAGLVAEIKNQLRDEMGLFPLQLLRERRSSFVALYATDDAGHVEYATAGYLGRGYFITVKHAVVPLPEGQPEGVTRRMSTIEVDYAGKKVRASLVDAGDADGAVQSGDWAIIRTRPLDLPTLTPVLSFPFDFAEPIARLGNDYSQGIQVANGYVGQRTQSGLVTCLTDGHPGVSGGGILDREGHLVGISIGRRVEDYRFSFILPLRAEMFRRIPPDDLEAGAPAPSAAAAKLPAPTH
jgi:hypothetical protein